MLTRHPDLTESAKELLEKLGKNSALLWHIMIVHFQEKKAKREV